MRAPGRCRLAGGDFGWIRFSVVTHLLSFVTTQSNQPFGRVIAGLCSDTNGGVPYTRHGMEASRLIATLKSRHVVDNHKQREEERGCLGMAQL